ncbi:ammonium transporter [Sphingomonas sp. NSE70-1]|uniref:Ammonium transporter n=1 Tax=Sphingomonas caseinilyticus TaxID=2908205 RepID=A0ABT0RV26_9SPHN|nr:ammonium transporter [Sphingomonas caseinilyticus]MCL6698693.1 ammonium transporter [Sphingomonas caseinilyticus]
MAFDSGDVAWVLTATLLVTMMLLPGLALFYGGLVRAKNLLSVMSQVMGVGAVAILVWVGWAYSLAFSGSGLIVGDLAKAGLRGIEGDTAWALATPGKAIPELLFACFQMSFAAITVALVVGALVERVRFSAMLLFTILFVSIVYAPIAHMVWAADGLILQTGAIDFAGGTVVHINAGIAGLVGVAFAGPRIGFLKEAMPPHSLALVLVGAGLLWVGWFGFNAGSALEANSLAAIAMLNTFVAPAAGMLGWMGIERWRSGKPSLLGGASGAVTGLVAVTPAAGISGPLGAILLGLAASAACYSFIALAKHRLRLDDSLDVFGIHGLGGIVGSVGTAIVAVPMLGGHGGPDYSLGTQLGRQVGAVLLAIGWSAAGSAICFYLTRIALPLRRDADEEREGLDLSEHGERAYNP